MVPSKVHHRHPTWPVTLQLLPKETTARQQLEKQPRYTAELPNISEGEDPFSHFLSPVLDEEASFAEQDSNYCAGITPYESHPASQQDALFRARLEEKWETFVARRLLQHSKTSSSATSIPPPLPAPFPQVAYSPPDEDAMPDLEDESMDLDAPATPDDGPASPGRTVHHQQWYFPSTIDDEDSMDDDDFYDDVDLSDHSSTEGDAELDGWAADRQTETRTRSRPIKFRTNKLRTLSGKKHAWREPSPRLWTVEEEDEVVVPVNISAARRPSPALATDRPRKKAKVVHWNEEVQVLEYER